jgi:hypothetical protein
MIELNDEVMREAKKSLIACLDVCIRARY